MPRSPYDRYVLDWKRRGGKTDAASHVYTCAVSEHSFIDQTAWEGYSSTIDKHRDGKRQRQRFYSERCIAKAGEGGLSRVKRSRLGEFQASEIDWQTSTRYRYVLRRLFLPYEYATKTRKRPIRCTRGQGGPWAPCLAKSIMAVQSREQIKNDGGS